MRPHGIPRKERPRCPGRRRSGGSIAPPGRLSRYMPDQRAPDRRVAELAARQHGAISVGQLRDAGLSADAILGRCRAGRLHPLHRGVYAVGHVAPSSERRWMAAVLAVVGGRGPADGVPTAVLSHRDAAALWRIMPPANGPVAVSLLSRSGKRRRRGIRIHRPVSLIPEETTCQRGIPVTTPARTLRDLQSAVPGQELRRAIRQAEFLGLSIGPGVASDKTRSELERRFLWLCGRHHLPRPAVNVPVGRMTVDFLWTEQELIVETDGYGSHRGRAAFEGDHARDLRLRTLGYDVLHFSARQVFDEPDRVIELVRATLTPPAGAR